MYVYTERAVSGTRFMSKRKQNPYLARRRHLRCVVRASGNYYDVLGLPETTTIDDINVAFRRKAKELHPDVSTEAGAEDQFKECSMAYEVLVDSQARQKYDQELLHTRQSSMGNFFHDVDFQDDHNMNLDEWRREQMESYRQPEPVVADERSGSTNKVLRDPAQFLDCLNSEQVPLPTCEDPPNRLIEQLEQVLAPFGEDGNFREFVTTYRHDPRELQYLRDEIDYDTEQAKEREEEGEEEDCNVQDEELGAWLQSFGVQQDAASFVQEMSVMSGAMQIASCALCLYFAECIGGYDTGESLRMTCGLGLGYLTRMSVKVENLMYPFYNDIVTLIAPASTTPFISGVNKTSVQETLSSTAYLLFLLLLLPQCFFHWDSQAAAQLIGPWALAWVLSDLFNIIALFIKVSRAN